MSVETKNFMEKYMSGEVFADDIDDFIDQYDDNDEINSVMETHEFLGLTWDEYRCWVTDDSALPIIIKARKENVDLGHLITQTKDKPRLAARGESKNSTEIESWLEKVL